MTMYVEEHGSQLPGFRHDSPIVYLFLDTIRIQYRNTNQSMITSSQAISMFLLEIGINGLGIGIPH